MKKTLLISIASSSFLAACLFACGGDNGNNNNPGEDGGGADQTSPTTDSGSGVDTGKTDTGTGTDATTTDAGHPDTGTEGGSEAGVDGGDAGFPAPPTLGTQIDRFGRPAVNTALNHVFDPDTSTNGTKNTAKDTYNADKVISNWATAYSGEFEKNLAVYDGLDTVCGNQPGFEKMNLPGYTLLATVLTADAMWLNTATTTCNQYLAVEFNALGVANTDCGGRTLTENVIDTTYNVAAGTIQADGGGPLTNGITAPGTAPLTSFPYLAPAHGATDGGAAEAGGGDAGDGGDGGIQDAGGQ